jgi:hypothetical protein
LPLFPVQRHLVGPLGLSSTYPPNLPAPVPPTQASSEGLPACRNIGTASGFAVASRRVGSVLRLSATAAAVLVVVIPAGCGGSDNPSQAELSQARKEGAHRARQGEQIRQLERRLAHRRNGGQAQGTPSAPSAPPPQQGTSSCGGGVSVGPNTSCAFAQNVAAAYRSSGQSPIEVFSPTTGQTYTMSCTAGSPHVCTGGNNASVYFP